MAKGTKRPPTVVKVNEVTETILSEDRVRELITSVMTEESKATSSLLERMAAVLPTLMAELAAIRAEVAESGAENAALKLQLEGRSCLATAPKAMSSSGYILSTITFRHPKWYQELPPLTY